MRKFLFAFLFSVCTVLVCVIGIVISEAFQNTPLDVAIPVKSYGQFFVVVLLPIAAIVGGLHGIGASMSTGRSFSIGLSLLLVLAICSSFLFAYCAISDGFLGFSEIVFGPYSPFILVSLSPLFTVGYAIIFRGKVKKWTQLN